MIAVWLALAALFFLSVGMLVKEGAAFPPPLDPEDLMKWPDAERIWFAAYHIPSQLIPPLQWPDWVPERVEREGFVDGAGALTPKGQRLLDRFNEETDALKAEWAAGRPKENGEING